MSHRHDPKKEPGQNDRVEYPEVRPENVPFSESFTFNLHVGAEQKKELEERIQRLRNQVDKETRNVIIDDTPLLYPILKMSSKPEDLKKLAEALLKLAPIFQELEKMERWKAAFDLADQEPDFYRWAFGDYTTVFDELFDAPVTEESMKQKHRNKSISPSRPAIRKVREL